MLPAEMLQQRRDQARETIPLARDTSNESRPCRWSWLQKTPGSQKSRKHRSAIKRRFRRATIVLLCFIIFWVLISLYYLFGSSFFSSEDESNTPDVAKNNAGGNELHHAAYNVPFGAVMKAVQAAENQENNSQNINDWNGIQYAAGFPVGNGFDSGDKESQLESESAIGNENPKAVDEGALSGSRKLLRDDVWGYIDLPDDDPIFVAERVVTGPVVTGPTIVKHTIRSRLYAGASPTRMHGVIGVFPDGTKGYVASQLPSNLDMTKVLAENGGMNIPLSDSLPLDRDPLDTRHSTCRNVFYDLTNLPEASVIIVFYNEPFTTLMRSVHSVLNLTPPTLLKEIILVDDHSDAPHIWKGRNEESILQKYIKLLPKTRLLRNRERTGIVGARLLGVNAARSDVFVILDSHIEVQPAWLEPLVSRIKQDRRHVIMPQIDGLDASTLEYHSGGIGCSLGLIWNLMEHAFTPNKRNPARMNIPIAEPIQSPTMAGGLFAAHKDFFLAIGGYDRGMKYWGVENLEFSFRLWQCGGILECSRCSRVYHIFRRGGSGYQVPDPSSLLKNKLRTMSVWMDNYADLSWNVLGRPILDFGDISSRLALREKLQCKPFKWFMTDVWPESDVIDLKRDVPYLGGLDGSHQLEMMKHVSLQAPSLTGATKKELTADLTEELVILLGQIKCFFHRWVVFPETGQIALVKDDNTYAAHADHNITITEEGRQCLAVDSSQLRIVPCLTESRLRGGNRAAVPELKLKAQVRLAKVYRELHYWSVDAELGQKYVIKLWIVYKRRLWRNDCPFYSFSSCAFFFQTWEWDRYDPPDTWTLPRTT